MHEGIKDVFSFMFYWEILSQLHLTIIIYWLLMSDLLCDFNGIECFPYTNVLTPRKEINGFVNISPTLVIDTSMERFSLVLQHGNPKILGFSKKIKIEFCPYLEKRNHPGFVNISPRLVIDTSMERSSRVGTTAWKPKNLIFFFKKVRNWILTWAEELKSIFK